MKLKIPITHNVCEDPSEVENYTATLEQNGTTTLLYFDTFYFERGNKTLMLLGPSGNVRSIIEHEDGIEITITDVDAN